MRRHIIAVAVALIVSMCVSCSLRTHQHLGGPIGVAAIPPLGSASKPFWGIAYGPYAADQSPASGRLPTAKQIAADMPHLAALANRIRIYSSDGIQARIPSLAERYGLTVWAGAWIGRDQNRNDREIAALIRIARQPGVEAVVVGNEVLYRNDQSIARLIKLIRRVRKAIPGRIPIAYADSGDVLLKRAPELAKEIDIGLANIHPYWGKVAISKAVPSLYNTYQSLCRAYPGKRVVIGETGWPSAGLPRGPALPGEKQELAFIESLSALTHEHPDLQYFFFDAFDEPYKRGGETLVEPFWGVCDTTGQMKSELAKTLPNLGALPLRVSALRRATANEHLVMRDGKIYPGLDIGVETDRKLRNWVRDTGNSLEFDYPAGQRWGSVFITCGKVIADPNKREVRDYSEYSYLLVELKSTDSHTSVQVGVKRAHDPENGTTPRYTIANVPRAWKRYRIPLSLFRDPADDTDRLKELYVVTEFTFTGSNARRLYVRNVQYAKGRVSMPTDYDVYGADSPGSGIRLGYATSEGVKNWVEDHKDYLLCRYPDGQRWGAVFFTIGNANNNPSLRHWRDLSQYRYLSLDVKGALGAEQLSVGMKTAQEPSDGSEPKYRLPKLTRKWHTIRIPLSSLCGTPSDALRRLKHTYVACELVFEAGCPAESVYVRRIHYHH